MGKLSTTKGKSFEREIAAMFRQRWPAVTFRRSSQAERAYQSDVFAEGDELLERFWFELQDARKPTPLAKLKQAELDISMLTTAAANDRLPIVVWHRIREQSIQVTTRLSVLDEIRGRMSRLQDSVVTLDLEEFVALVKEAA